MKSAGIIVIAMSFSVISGDALLYFSCVFSCVYSGYSVNV